MSPETVVFWVQQAQASLFLALLFYIGFIAATLIFPITLFPIIGGVLFPFSVALPLNLLATIAGACLSFRIGRNVGRDPLHRFFGDRMKSWDQAIKAKGFKAVFLVRWLGLPPYTFANYAFGLSDVRMRDYVFGTLAGVLPWTIAVTYMADSVWRSFVNGGQAGLKSVIFDLWWPTTLFSILVLVTYGSGRLIRTYIRTLPR